MWQSNESAARAATVARSKTHIAMVQRMGWFTPILVSASLELSIAMLGPPLRRGGSCYGPLGSVLDRFKVEALPWTEPSLDRSSLSCRPVACATSAIGYYRSRW